MSKRFEGRTAIVTGCGKGLGRSITIGLIQHGCKLVIGITRSDEDIKSLAAEVGNESCFVGVQSDLGEDPEGAMDKAIAILTERGNLDLDYLVNNAGINVPQPIESVTKEAWHKIMDVNAYAPLVCTQKAVAKMIEGSKIEEKSIVNISSQASLFGIQDHVAYSMSKAALDLLTKSCALELSSKYKIRCNSVNPTVVMTPLGRRDWGDPEKGGPMLSKIPLAKFAEEEDVVNPVLFLLNAKESGMLNGHCIPIEGGLVSVCKMK